MTAEVGQTYAWDITKSANPTSLNFANTCLDTTGSRSQNVQITVTWTRSGPTASGATTITTAVTAINPAHRTITVQATDKIYEGAGQTTLLDQATGAAVDVPALTSMVVLGHSFVYNGSATTFNDVATATYTDKVTGIPVPGATSATASATAVPAGGAPAQSSVSSATPSRSPARAWPSRSRLRRSVRSPAAMSPARRRPAPSAGRSRPQTAGR